VIFGRKRRSFLVVRGRVEKGVVVLENGIHLPEGQEVTVMISPEEGTKSHGILDIPPVHLGAVLLPLSSDDDMLESRT
jgi:hypothetical protein